MKILVLLQLLLLPIAGIAYDAADVAADEGSKTPRPSATCNPWSTNYWGHARVTTQAEADEFACFRRIVGSLTVVHSHGAPIEMPKLRAVVGDLKVVFSQPIAPFQTQQDLRAMLPVLEEIRGDATLLYPRREDGPQKPVGLTALDEDNPYGPSVKSSAGGV